MTQQKTQEPEQLQNPVNGNRSLICFAISLPLTTALIIVIVVLGGMRIVQTGLPLFILAVASVIAGLGFGIRGAQRHEGSAFRYQWGIVFNAIMLFSLFMILAMFFFVRRYGPGMMTGS
ncbi:MAG TPA: hypothetical protein VG722_01455 [Tepidisphaeraceae bacterium]|nr:hypothetical protein [Tepidisphaeraceae bacterium]